MLKATKKSVAQKPHVATLSRSKGSSQPEGSWEGGRGEGEKDIIEIEREDVPLWKIPNYLQYKSLKVIRNGGKSKKSKTSFGASPIEDLDGFYQRKSDFNSV